MKATDLRPGSFRGVTFDCRQIGGVDGHRHQINEFPGRDDVTWQGNGKAPIRFRLECVLRGEDWKTRYDALLAACRREGPGELLHPDGTRCNAILTEPADHSIAAVGEATVTLSLIRVSAAPLPTATAAPKAAVAAKVAAAQAKLTDDFAQAWSDARQAAIDLKAELDSLSSTISKATESVRAYAPPAELWKALSAAQELRGNLNALARSPRELAAQWQSFIGGISDLATLSDLSESLGAQSSASTAAYLLGLSGPQTPSRAAELLNVALADHMAWTMAVTGAAAAVGAAEWVAYDDAKAAVAACNDRVAAAGESEVCQPGTIAALTDVRAAVVDTVLVAALDLPRVRSYTPDRVISAAELAQLLYGDGSRATEIVDRNAVQHPGFLGPHLTLAVLTD